MSLQWRDPWRDRLTVLVSPERVSVLRARRGWRVQPLERVDVACAAGQQALAVPAALTEALAELQAGEVDRRGAFRPLARIVLSHRLAPLCLVPHARALRNEHEREAAARHAFEVVHGAATADWQIVVDRASADTALAAGIAGPLIEGLRHCLAEARVALRSIEPLLVSAAANAVAALHGGPAWLVVAEPQQVVLARHDGGVWCSLRTHRPRHSLASDLGAWIRQARLIDGVDGPDAVVVLAAEHHDLELLRQPGWRIEQAPLPAWQAARCAV
nr:hypothetical protein [uncultured Roseateles sp.]